MVNALTFHWPNWKLLPYCGLQPSAGIRAWLACLALSNKYWSTLRRAALALLKSTVPSMFLGWMWYHTEGEGAQRKWRGCPVLLEALPRSVDRRHRTCGDLTRSGVLKMSGSCGFHCTCIGLSRFRHIDQRSSLSQRPTADPSVLYHSLKFDTQPPEPPKQYLYRCGPQIPSKLYQLRNFPFT